MARWVGPGLVLTVVIGGAVAAGVFMLGPSAELIKARTPDPLLGGMAIPSFELVDQDGSPIDESTFHGQITIVDFFFSHCQLVCPILTGTMADLTHRLDGTDVRFLSISVDPTHDTPEQIRAFGERYGADFDRWTFATGTEDQVERIVSDGLHFELSKNDGLQITLPDGSTMSNVVHPSRLLLVDGTGRVLGMYRYTLESDLDQLVTRARLIAAH